jgi:hypothetical protein
MGYFLTSQRNKASQLAHRLDLAGSLFILSSGYSQGVVRKSCNQL